jgi:SARP family transcriptional regulator, regulator of embCAB operon
MELKVLGPLEARLDGKSIVPSAGKPRQVLAMLALDAGHVVSVPLLIEELWGCRPPRSALTTLQTYVMRVRRHIEAALAGGPAGEGSRDAKELLVTRAGGYLLDVDPAAVDVRDYERLLAAGARAAGLAEYESASQLLRSALDVWRGRALVDVHAGPRLSVEAIRLEESRLGALEMRIDVGLRLGQHYLLLSELAMLTASYPMHENLCAQFMVALYRSGQQWRALEAYRRLRDTLVGELGVEPSARLQQLHRAILRSDPTLDEHRVRTDLREKLAM